MPNNYDTRVGPGGGAQMYVNGQWLDENLFSPGTGLAGELSPKQEANAGYAPGSAQSSNNPYLGETPDPGTNLYEPWRTPAYSTQASGGSPAGVPPAQKPINTTNLAAQGDNYQTEVKPDGYGDLANMYGQQAKKAANAGYTGVAKTLLPQTSKGVTGAQGSALAAASAQAQAPLSNKQISQVVPPTPKFSIPSGPVQATTVSGAQGSQLAAPMSRGGQVDSQTAATTQQILKDEWELLPNGMYRNKRTGEIASNPNGTGTGGINTTGLGGEQRTGERTIGADSWEYLGDGVYFNPVTLQQTATPPQSVLEKGGLAGGAFEQRKGEQNPNTPQAEGSNWTFIGDRKWLNVLTGEVSSDPQVFSRGGEAGKITQESSGSRPVRDFGDFGVAEMILGYPVKAGWVETSPGVWEKDSPTAKKVLEAQAEESQTFGEQVNRYAGLEDKYKVGNQSGSLFDQSGPPRDAHGNLPSGQYGYPDATGTGTTTKAQLADAARWTGQAINFDSWPNIITERLTEELNWAGAINPNTGANFASAAEFLESAGYMEDPNNPGLWQRLDETNPTMGGSGGGSGYGYKRYKQAPYSYNGSGGRAWANYGYSRGGGGYGASSGYGSGYGGGGNQYGLINWRIG